VAFLSEMFGSIILEFQSDRPCAAAKFRFWLKSQSMWRSFVGLTLAQQTPGSAPASAPQRLRLPKIVKRNCVAAVETHHPHGVGLRR
jgi:hypothetical protein